MYLFFFAALLIVFMYMNQKSIYDVQQKSITSLTKQVKKRSDSIAVLNDQIADLNYFTLQGNDNATDYLERLGMDSVEVENMVAETIYEMNLQNGGNSLIPLAGEGQMRVNKVKFLNHRWLVADFSDGSAWGEMVVEYFFNENKELELTVISSVLYP
jgi:hypothetical protein